MTPQTKTTDANDHYSHEWLSPTEAEGIEDNESMLEDAGDLDLTAANEMK